MRDRYLTTGELWCVVLNSVCVFCSVRFVIYNQFTFQGERVAEVVRSSYACLWKRGAPVRACVYDIRARNDYDQ